MRAIARERGAFVFPALGDMVRQPTDTYRYRPQCAVSEDVRMTIPSRNHLEIGFEVWEDGDSWFWLVVSPHSARGTIGAAPTEAEAISAARSQIEDPSE